MKQALRLLSLMTMLVIMSVHAGDRHYESTGGFSYEVPNGWRVMSYGGLKFKIIITDPINDFSPNMTFVDEDYAGDLAAYLEANIPSMESGIPGFTILRRCQSKTRTGIPYHSLRYTHKADIGTLKQTAHMLSLEGDRKLVATCTPPPGHEARFDAICDEVVQSIRLDRH